MKTRFLLILQCLAMLGISAYAAVEEMAPDEIITRKKIDSLIKHFQDDKKKATLGLLQEAYSLSIAYGAPTWNLGDHGSCSRFYTKTAESLCSAFKEDNTATDAARTGLADLRESLRRISGSSDNDHIAWTMRFAFDKNQIACSAQTGHVQGLMALGTQYFKLSRFEEARDAFQSSVALLKELDGQDPESIPADCRFAALALGNAYFAEKKYTEASNAMVLGLEALPQWTSITVDLRSFHNDPSEYETLMEDLEAKAAKQSDDAALQFLLGYEYYFTEKKNAAKDRFQRTLKLKADHAAAKMFLKRLESLPLKADKPEKDETPQRPNKAQNDA